MVARRHRPDRLLEVRADDDAPAAIRAQRVAEMLHEPRGAQRVLLPGGHDGPERQIELIVTRLLTFPLAVAGVLENRHDQPVPALLSRNRRKRIGNRLAPCFAVLAWLVAVVHFDDERVCALEHEAAQAL